jgi:hypothetical protein
MKAGRQQGFGVDRSRTHVGGVQAVDAVAPCTRPNIATTPAQRLNRRRRHEYRLPICVEILCAAWVLILLLTKLELLGIHDITSHIPRSQVLDRFSSSAKGKFGLKFVRCFSS